MKDFIEILQILLKYGDRYNPFFCDRDVIYFTTILPEQVSTEDIAALENFGVFISDQTGEDLFYSYRYGS